MKILTIGPSPHLLTKNGRINRDILLSLSSAGHYVETLVWHHDVSYFLPNEMQEHVFEYDKKRICRIHPYIDERGGLAMGAYELMKKVQPSVVITIGATHESIDIWSIKALYPHLFKWICILTEGSPIINEYYAEQIGYADLILASSKSAVKAVNKISPVSCIYVPYGPDTKKFTFIEERPPEFGVFVSGKNSQMSNLTACIKALSDSGIEGYIHTNIDDPGDSDLRLLLRRFNVLDRIGLPEQNYVSIREGIEDKFLNGLYNRYHAVLDVSMQSATALSMLEAMATGCVPIGIEFGAIGEVISCMPKEFQFWADYCTLIGPREEEYAVANASSITRTLNNMKNLLQNKETLLVAQKKSCEVANIFEKELFINKVNEEVEKAISYEHAIVVDSF